MEALMQASSATHFLHESTKPTHEKRVLKNQVCYSFSVQGCSSPRPFSASKLSFEAKSRTSVIAGAKKKKDKTDSHSFAVNPDEIVFPEAVLLKEKRVQEDGRIAPEFADAEEEKLYESLNLQLESDLNYEELRHYEVVYLIHEDHDEEVENVNTKIQEFLKEKKGKIWRVNDWGLRRLQYKIKKANNAHYILMNFELEAKWINDFKTMLDKDERVIRHLVIKMDEAVTEDCPPPPDFDTVYAEDDYEDSDEDEEDDDEEEDDEEEEDEEEETELDVAAYIDEDGTVVVVDEEDDVEEDTSTRGKERTLA